MDEEIGVVVHFYGKIGVAVVKLTGKSLKAGQTIHIQGNTTDFVQKVDSLQVEHQNIDEAKKGEEVGLKVDNPVRGGDKVFLVE